MKVMLITRLNQHLTVQIDDSHAPHVFIFLKAIFSVKKIRNMSSLVHCILLSKTCIVSRGYHANCYRHVEGVANPIMEVL
ncbi:unnamed protein product [Sphagnum jensenii]|uniref:Uncharacterized protein n=1 Tax=Sphagnum jensenii TaxID=128206 RepID=A0ABP1BLM8_9BRYO